MMSSYIDKKFINLVSGTLDKFAWKKDTLANCRCPICGDSQKNKNKARGFFYQKNNDYLFKCHNCGIGCNINTFLKRVSPSLVKEYRLEKFKSGSSESKRKPETMLSFKKPEFNKHNLNFLSPLTCVNDLKSKHPCVEFLNLRMIPKQYWKYLYFTDDFGAYSRILDPDNTAYIGREPRLVIPFFNKKNEVVGAQGRSLALKDEANARATAKYITLKADKSIERLWYGMWRADPKKPVYIVEGPLDSLFIPNTIAMVGASAIDQMPARFQHTKMIFVLDNEPRNPQIVRYNKKLIDMGHNVCIWPTYNALKDINDMVYTMSTKSIKKLIDENTCSGLAAELRLKQWSKV